MGLKTFALPGMKGISEVMSAPIDPVLMKSAPGYGPLLPDPQGVLNLPKDFSYKIIMKQGQPMSDGLLSPGKPDGMATFRLDDKRTLIIRNHELDNFHLQESAYGAGNFLLGKISPNKMYDVGAKGFPAQGGTTTLIYDHDKGEVVKSFLSLAGTSRNCAGGPTPWGSWITCEEAVYTVGGHYAVDHGYCFEVPANPDGGLVDPVPLKAMGRFNHEAICVDPKTGIVYLTEDRHDGLFYRFIPNQPWKLAAGGKLQALAIKGSPSYDTRNWPGIKDKKILVGDVMEVEWMDLTDIESPKDDLRFRGFASGTAIFARGEGTWFGEGELYFACTNGGYNMQGQVWRYTPSAEEGKPGEKKAPGKLELFVETTDELILKNCDNLTVSPHGGLVMCEDDPHPFLIGVTPKGALFKIAENTRFPSEFAGVCFAPDGKTLFVNIQHYGMTLAITGPFDKVVMEQEMDNKG